MIPFAVARFLVGHREIPRVLGGDKMAYSENETLRIRGTVFDTSTSGTAPV